MHISAVLVTAGGRSRRLGTSKPWLHWSGQPLLLHVLDRLAPLARHRIVAARPGQDLPAGGYQRVNDAVSGAGPLAALAAGLACAAALTDRRARVAVSACDYPFADRALLVSLAVKAPDADVVLPRLGGYDHPLHAVWRASLAEPCWQALADGTRRVVDFLATVDCVTVDAEEVIGAEQAERALLNLNRPADLARARELAAEH